ncbi:unnamed protein product [Cylicocyclus nassatus]|uniref:Uncharacterized protein n=1 Tax=Cylicocyclus nassatus TaxID=53992 RepID=A0AA36H292_CYLNA|nr:unnamed protein product [Cylicocyclus nassatus]
MAFLFHKKPIAYSARTLGTLLEKYKGYAEEISPCGNETKQYDELNNAVELISGGMKLIKQSRDALQVLVDKLEKEFDDLKMKGSRKELVSEIEDIEKETQFSEKIAAANDTLYVLEARLNETRSKVKRIARKLDMPVNTETVSTPSEIAMKGVSSGEEREFSPNATEWLSEDLLVNSVAESEDLICRTLKPKQLKRTTATQAIKGQPIALRDKTQEAIAIDLNGVTTMFAKPQIG